MLTVMTRAGSNRPVTKPTSGVLAGAARRSSLCHGGGAERARFRDEVGRLIGIRRHGHRLLAWRSCKRTSQTHVVEA